MQQLLFEYAVTYDATALLPPLVEAGFRHARRVESGREFIERTHYAPYVEKRSSALSAQLHKHGVDFRNPLNETPLMIAARFGRADLVEQLLALGADPELRDNAGRTALRIALKAWRDTRLSKAASFSLVYRQLARGSLRVKVGNRMVKLDPSAMEWFLLNFCLVEYRRMLPSASQRGIPALTAPLLEGLLAAFPDAVLPPHRKKRAYLSAMLSKNELGGSHPYNRRLFVRVGHGLYVPNPAIEIGDRGEWKTIADLMGLPALFASIGAAGEFADKWWTALHTRTQAALAQSQPSAPAPEADHREALPTVEPA